jgi:hypothetical protein
VRPIRALKRAEKGGIIQTKGANYMPVKAKPATKVAPKAKAAPKKKAEGDAYACEVCGLVVAVEEPCGCVDACEIICCGEPMKAKTAPKAKAAKK